MNKKYLFLAVLSGAIIAIDQAVKIYIHTQFSWQESFTVIQDYFNITYVRNEGAAFGFLAKSHPSFREFFFLSMPPIALLIILAIMRGVAETDRWQIIALSLVFGGAIGNYIDRLRFRYVIDFLDFHYKGIYSWPAFNIADMAIVSGVSLLVFLMFYGPRANPIKEKEDSPTNVAELKRS